MSTSSVPIHQSSNEFLPNNPASRQSESSFDNTSSQWSLSTKASIPNDSLDSATEDDEDRKSTTNGCLPLVQIFHSLFNWRAALWSIDNSKLLEDLKGHTNLIIDFFDGSLTPQIKLYAEQVHLHKIEPFGKFELSQNKDMLFLPVAQVWTAMHLLNLRSECDLHHSLPNVFSEKADVQANCDFVNSNSFRRLIILLYWEIQLAKKVARDFCTRFIKFSNEINRVFKRIQTVLLTSSMIKAGRPSKSECIPKDDNIKRKLELYLKRNRSSMILDSKPNCQNNFPFSLSIDTVTASGRFLKRNQDCSRISSKIKDELIMNLLNSVVQSIENCQSLLESGIDRISSRGIIKKGSNGSKDVTCYSALNSVKLLTMELLSRSNTTKLDELEQNQLHCSILLLQEKWSEFYRNSQWIIVKFYELCDMITLSYWFALQHIKMNIPEAAVIKKEVNVKSKYPKNGEVTKAQKDSLKHYSIGVLIEECNVKCSNSNAANNKRTPEMGNLHYYQSTISKKCHLAIRECPLEVENNCGRYIIRVRPLPDLEKVDSEMIFVDTDYLMDIQKQKSSMPVKFKLVENIQLPTFKNNISIK